MCKDSENTEHIMVRNPISGKLVNVMPLFQLMQDCPDAVRGAPANLAHLIQDIHDFVSSCIQLDSDSTIESQFSTFRGVNYRLVQMRKAFEDMEPDRA